MKSLLSNTIKLSLLMSLFLLFFQGRTDKSNSGLDVNIDLNNPGTHPFGLTIGGNISHYGAKINAWNKQAFEPIQEVGIRSVRTHDVKPLDWDLIFTDWNADENSESSYHFQAADSIMDGMAKYNFVPFMRLGVSFGSTQPNRKIGRNPPNPDKWARIAERIIAHYTDGWDNGFKYPIRYIEIWNEPDLAFYMGGYDNFKVLMAKSLTLIKREHPNLLVGGPAVANVQVHRNYCNDLIAYLADPSGTGNPNDRVPLDFFSWHVYEMKQGSDKFVQFAKQVRTALDRNGYNKTLSICTEWNTDLPSDYVNSVNAGVDAGCTIMAAENLGVHAIYFYPLIETWGLFKIGNLGSTNFKRNQVNVNWTTMAWALSSYNSLRKETPKRLQLQSNNNNFQVLAGQAADGSEIKILIGSRNAAGNVDIHIAGANGGSYNAVWQQLTSTGMNIVNKETLKPGRNGIIELKSQWQAPELMMVSLTKQ